MEEERARQRAGSQPNEQDKEGDVAQYQQQQIAVEGGGANAAGMTDDIAAMDEDTLLQEALALSIQGPNVVENRDEVGNNQPPKADGDEDMDPELAMALQMSMAGQGTKEDDDKEDEKEQRGTT